MHPLTHRLQGLEAISRPRCMNADDFRVGVFHGDEDIGPAFPDGDRLRHVRSTATGDARVNPASPHPLPAYIRRDDRGFELVYARFARPKITHATLVDVP